MSNRNRLTAFASIACIAAPVLANGASAESEYNNTKKKSLNLTAVLTAKEYLSGFSCRHHYRAVLNSDIIQFVM